MDHVRWRRTRLAPALACLVVGLAAAPLLSADGPQQPGAMVFTEPSPMDFGDHQGYVSLFDGVSLKGWDGNPKFWRVENGAIVGESTAANPSGNSYIVYRDVVAKDFTLKFEIKIEGEWRKRPPVPQQDRGALAREDPGRRSRPTSARSTSNG